MKKLQTASLLFAVLMLGLALSGCDRFLVPENRRSEPLPSSERWPRQVVPTDSSEGNLLERWESAVSTLPNDIPADSISRGVLWVMAAAGAGWANLASPVPAWHRYALDASAMSVKMVSSLPVAELKHGDTQAHLSNENTSW